MAQILNLKDQPLKPGKKNHSGEGGGRPRKIKSAAELEDYFYRFIEDLIASEYEVLPSRMNFCKWLKKNGCDISYRKLLETINVYYAPFKETLTALQADVLIEGATYGPYDRTTVIFTLKNWCNWTDKRDLTTERKDKVQVASPEEAQKALEDLGYVKSNNG